MANVTIFGLEKIFGPGQFGRVFTSKELPMLPAGRTTRPLPGKWVAQEFDGVWYIGLGGVDDWHDLMLKDLEMRVGESKMGIADGTMTPTGGPEMPVEIRVGRNTASIPADVTQRLAEAITAAWRIRKA
jgi:hypothetical protein